MTTRTSGSGRVAICIVTRSSTSARIATADIAIAAWSAATKPVWISGGAPTAGISKAKQDDWIIAIGNATTGNAAAPPPRKA
jgi:hypothetical protein